MIVTSVQIKTVKTQKHLYCPVFTNRESVGLQQIPDFPFVYKGFRRFCGAADVTLLWAIMGYSGFKLHMNCPFPENAQKMLAKPARM